MSSQTMRILVTGSRDWENPFTVSQAIQDYVDDIWENSWHMPDEPTIVHGDCPTGADHWADLYARTKRWTVEAHPADWKKYGRAAGPKRNQEMVDLGADVVLAFMHPGSRGTKDCADRAVKAGLRVRLIRGEKN